MIILHFIISFLVACQTLVLGLPIFSKSKTYSRDDVLKRLLKQNDGIQNVNAAIEPLKENLKTKKKMDITKIQDKAKISILNYKEKVHLKNEKQLIGIVYGGKAKVSKDLFGNKKYKAIQAHTSTISDLDVLFNNVFGLPMFQNGEHKESKVLFLTPNAKEQHMSFEETLFSHHHKDARNHKLALKEKSIINPTRLYNKYQKHCATKRCDHNMENILEIDKVPAEGGFVHLTKTRSGKGRHYQAITKDQAEVLQDRKIPSNKH